MIISKATRGKRDLPQMESVSIVAATAGSGTDFENIIVSLPKLAQGAPSGTAGEQGDNTMVVRWFNLTWAAGVTGANTNTATIQLNQRRGGALLVNTTSSTAVAAAGSATITVGASGAVNCYVGQYLNISGGTGTPETVVVTAYNAATNTITANFANTHSSTYNVVSTPLASVTYVSGTNDSAFAPRQVAALANVIKPGDALTVSRVSAGTGLATPAGEAQIEWVLPFAQ